MTQPLPTSFHTLKRGTIDVTDENCEPPKTWRIRDDTPMAIIVQYIDIMMQLRQYEHLRERIADDPAQATQVKEAYLAMDRMHAEYLLAVFQHSYPETTLAEIEEHFASEDRQELAALFFIRRTQRSSQQQSSVVAMAQTQAHTLASKTTTNPKRRTH